MKSKFLIMFLFIILEITGCSDGTNPLGIAGEEHISNINSDNIQKNKRLIWKNDGITVNANGEFLVYSELNCDLYDDNNSRILITFNGWTNADTTSYVSLLTVECDGNTVLIESGEQYINRYHELQIDNTRTGKIRFYISLWCDEVLCNSSAVLELSKINVYNY